MLIEETDNEGRSVTLRADRIESCRETDRGLTLVTMFTGETFMLRTHSGPFVARWRREIKGDATGDAADTIRQGLESVAKAVHDRPVTE